jgi:hypothetical protein
MFTLTIETDGAAFDQPGEELSRILAAAAHYVRNVMPEDDGLTMTVRDVNGNSVGEWRYDRPASAPEVGETSTCTHCDEPITLDDNGAGATVWVHDHGSTVCYDEPAGSVEDGTTAFPWELAR